MSEPLPTLCCGTRFGRAYIEGLCRSSKFTLAGIFARGSDRSREIAEKYGVPLYTSLEQIPDTIKAACVVIRSSIVGGVGTNIALSLLRRGIHVIQEHPLHQREVAMCQQAASDSGCVYYLNTHHIHISETQRFLNIVHELRKEQPISFINALCGVQVVCSLLDILGRMIGSVTPYDFDEYKPINSKILEACDIEAFPYEVLRGHISNTPTTLAVQNYYDPADPDNNAAILHRITVGFPSGNLTLMSASGPVTWSDRLHFPNEIFNMENSCRAGCPIIRVLDSQEETSLSSLVEQEWPQAVTHALEEFQLKIQGQDPFSDRNSYEQELCTLWTDCMKRLGAPRLVSTLAPPDVLPEIIKSQFGKPSLKV
ncbi:Gfo/Idh/MocA family oxidoreductase [Desulfovibrio sp. UCD-KL4C]|uniref:Gfo/Idh/MocA family oxidoreductase n=1 Tax=Desulfovibrio sp. UCD-KL4C TaxID=2578120 RepID=UPI0025C280FC|nr:Gfo/Idh/MocA family oxidoreductase [Desulfovibrio sp. UCD-KL4C]